MLMRAKYKKHRGAMKIKWRGMKDDGGDGQRQEMWEREGGGGVCIGRGEGSSLVCLVS